MAKTLAASSWELPVWEWEGPTPMRTVKHKRPSSFTTDPHFPTQVEAHIQEISVVDRGHFEGFETEITLRLDVHQSEALRELVSRCGSKSELSRELVRLEFPNLPNSSPTRSPQESPAKGTSPVAATGPDVGDW